LEEIKQQERRSARMKIEISIKETAQLIKEMEQKVTVKA